MLLSSPRFMVAFHSYVAEKEYFHVNGGLLAPSGGRCPGKREVAIHYKT